MPYYTGTTSLLAATLTLSFCMFCELASSMLSNLKPSVESPSHQCPIVTLNVQPTSPNEGTPASVPLSNPLYNKGICHQSLKNFSQAWCDTYPTPDLLSYLCGYKSNKLLPP